MFELIYHKQVWRFSCQSRASNLNGEVSWNNTRNTGSMTGKHL
jgi:hypothetical protein